jgi:hypothetical protein
VGDEHQDNESGQAASSDDASSSDSSSSAGTQSDNFMDTHGNSRLTTEEQRNDQRPVQHSVITPGETKDG